MDLDHVLQRAVALGASDLHRAQSPRRFTVVDPGAPLVALTRGRDPSFAERGAPGRGS